MNGALVGTAMVSRGKPRIAVTMGDIGGIGPEVALRALSRASVRRVCRPAIVGDVDFFRRLARQSGISLPVRKMSDWAKATGRAVYVADVVSVPSRCPLGGPSKAAGQAAGTALEKAVELALAGCVEGIVTAPVSKESFALAGYGTVGHTELLADLTGTRVYAMMLTSRNLRVVFATTHVPIREAARKLTRRGLLDKFRLTHRYLRLYMGIERAKIAVACLNPHGGEGGRLGREEALVIEPAVRAAVKEGICVDGPYPADAIYRPEVAGRFDAIVAMYHDQGMIPLKLQGHGDVVNITLGIPCVRTSPGHGTAFDIAGTWRASDRSMRMAIHECARIAKRLRHAC